MSHLIQKPNYSYLRKEKNIYKTVQYSAEENKIWGFLYANQIRNLKRLAHPDVLTYLKELSLPEDNIPQLEEVSKKLKRKTGWQVIEVNDLIESETFFELLSNRLFPSTLYIRGSNELTLSRDPDIFHELFGHCPFLLDGNYANLFEQIGKLGLKFSKQERGFLQRLFWFTFETGIIKTKEGVRIYGGSLVSSIQESRWAIKNEKTIKPFNIIDFFRTPYRADLLQSNYYMISHFNELFFLIKNEDNIKRNMETAYGLGEFLPPFPIEEEYSKYMSYNICKFIVNPLPILGG